MRILLLLAVLAVSAFAADRIMIKTPAGMVSALSAEQAPPPITEGQQPTHWVVTNQQIDGVLAWDGTGTKLICDQGEVFPLVSVRDVASLDAEAREELQGIDRIALVMFGDTCLYLPIKCVGFLPAAEVPRKLSEQYAADFDKYAAERKILMAAQARQEKRAAREEKKRVAGIEGREWLRQQEVLDQLSRIQAQSEATRRAAELRRFGK